MNQSLEVQTQLVSAQTQLNELTSVQNTLKAELTRARAASAQAKTYSLAFDDSIVTNFETDLGNLTEKTDVVRVRVTALQVSIGQKLTDQGFQVGLLSVVNCYQLNLRYQAVIWQTCDTVYNPMAKSMRYCLTIFVLLVVADWVRRWLRPSEDEKRSSASTFAMHNRKDKGYLGRKFKSRASSSVHPADEAGHSKDAAIADLATIIVQQAHEGGGAAPTPVSTQPSAEAGAGAGAGAGAAAGVGAGQGHDDHVDSADDIDNLLDEIVADDVDAILGDGSVGSAAATTAVVETPTPDATGEPEPETVADASASGEAVPGSAAAEQPLPPPAEPAAQPAPAGGTDGTGEGTAETAPTATSAAAASAATSESTV